jgi:hypothetical protein
MKGMKSVEYRIWARSYKKYKGNFAKLSDTRDSLRKIKKRLLELSDFKMDQLSRFYVLNRLCLVENKIKV